MSEFKHLGCVLDELGIDEVVCHRKVVSGWKVAGVIRALVNDSGMKLECARDLHKTLIVLVLMYGSETMIGRDKERSRIKAV